MLTMTIVLLCGMEEVKANIVFHYMNHNWNLLRGEEEVENQTKQENIRQEFQKEKLLEINRLKTYNHVSL